MSEDLLKWLLGGAVAGYIPLGVFIYFLVKKLLEAKDECVAITRETLIQNRELNELLESVNCMAEKVLRFFTRPPDPPGPRLPDPRR
jgi:hypothetical protein